MLSAAMIVKNEEPTIRRCLDCLCGWVDEIVVGDTGSTDRTGEIASSYAQVRLFQSSVYGPGTTFDEFQFPVARNEHLDECRGPWAIWWDADDYVPEETGKRIRGVVESAVGPACYDLRVRAGHVLLYHTRLFPTGMGVRFSETHGCHEVLVADGLERRRCADVVIEHRPGRKDTPSSVRNLAILECDYFKRGRQDARTCFYLANAYRETRRWQEAVRFYDLYLSVSGWREERYFARYFKALALVADDRHVEARNELLLAISEDDRFAESYCLLGDLYLRGGDTAKARGWYEMAVQCEVPNCDLFVSPQFYHAYPTDKLRECDRRRGTVASAPVSVSGVRESGGGASVDGQRLEVVLPEDRESGVLALAALSLRLREEVDLEPVVFVRDEWLRRLTMAVPRCSLGSDPGPDAARLDSVVGVDWGAGGHASLDAAACLGVESGEPPTLALCVDQAAVADSMDEKQARRAVLWTGRLEWTGWEALGWSFTRSGLEVVQFRNDNHINGASVVEDDPVSAVHELAAASVFVGAKGWAHHLAYALGCPAVVLWTRDEDRSRYGYRVQEAVLAHPPDGNELPAGDVVRAVRRLLPFVGGRE